MNKMENNDESLDTGIVVDGTISIDDYGSIILTDDDGEKLNLSKHFEKLNCKKIRFTCITIESMERICKLLDGLNSQKING